MSVHDPIDELAALFLTEPDIPATGGGFAATPTVELLIVGHLPVRAGVWLAPYADALARETGAAALLRLDDSAAQLQIFRGDAQAVAWPNGQPRLRETMRSMFPTIGLWSIRAPHDTPEVRVIQAGADRVTILSSADQAAVVESYRLIKQLAEVASQIGCPTPKIGMAILGSEEDEGRRVVERLNETAMSFLETELELVLCLPRIDAGMIARGTRRFTSEPCPSPTEAIRWLTVERIESEREPAESHASPPLEGGTVSASTPPWSPALPVAEKDLQMDPVMDQPSVYVPVQTSPAAAAPVSVPEPLRARPMIPDAPVSPVSPAATVPAATAIPASHVGLEASIAGTAVAGPHPQVETAAAPGTSPIGTQPSMATEAPVAVQAGVELEPKQPCHPREPDTDGQPIPLAHHVTGLSPLPVRCPRHERIELAIDRDGRLHLLGREDMIREMQVVQRWALDHRELLSLAYRDTHISPRLQPKLHLFTESPLTLADLHGSDIQLHVLAPVRVGDQTGWFCSPLNEV